MSPTALPKLVAPEGSTYILEDAAANADVREKLAGQATTSEADKELERAFETCKARMIQLNPRATASQKARAMKSLSEEAAASTWSDEAPPIPGGVGYGMYYRPEYQFDWVKGTSVAWDIVCPVPPGGNVATFLYLTATNRSSKGVEALVAYNGQNDVGFHVFDWARPASDRWKHFPFASVADYLRTEPAGADTVQVLPLMNVTYQRNDGSWMNEVWLNNHGTGQWDLVYQFNYTATDEEQRSIAIGYWGPIVETFQASYSGTRAMGALNTRLAQLNSGAAWEPWQALTAGECSVHTDDKGFTIQLINPNDSWVVTS